ncbi:TRAP transporter large permease [Lactonifactor longoviformis]|uniref:TRAP transporter, DctM subunit n=1 Tax=Lactonifactor longoviformis DSM 17459 TaxID=1122155 RepID=A0A1M4UVT8_9CLOT|nr:TRAP transporter large permease [Lactonifactor longoviformis]POP33786.1 TRAP transporter large permease [Lactonifactor longoviformis]SHE60805.1 TRAP transporter, DctM subunit [Lactonifactor longoviformis DSM 17459]
MSGNLVLICAIVMVILMFLKVPVFIAVLAASGLYFAGNPNVASQIFAQRVMSGSETLSLLAIPFFVCSGVFMNYSGVTKRIMDFCSVITGKMYGGLAQVNVLLSTLMGGLSGSNLADAAMEAKMLVPEMEKKGFTKSFSTVVTAVSAMITPLIPPGIAMIIYGTIANVSIGKLFVAGIGPGVLLCAAMMILVRFMSKKRGYLPTRTERVPPAQLWAALRKAILPLLLPLVIIGGIRLGIFTPTEAGAVAIIYALILAVVYRELSVGGFREAIKETVFTTSSVMVIIAAASAFSWILTYEKIPQQFTSYMISVCDNKYVFLIAVNIFLILVGMFIEGNATMLILVPMLAPVANQYGIDPIQFAMIYIFNSSIGCVTPPLGTLIFVTCGITKCKIRDFISEAGPFYIMLLICLLLLTFVPFFSTGLVNLIY